jgi:5'-methylthioadenosine phosphorylase
VASVGGIRADLGPGTVAVPHQIIDYTWGRKSTFFEGRDQPVTHVDFTHPYTEALRQRLLAAAGAAGEPVVAEGVYATTQGPRLETAAEIDRLERDGATMVGMTGMPEAALAREIGLHYAAIAVVANHAAGRGDSRERIRMEDINAILQKALGRVRNILEHLVAEHGGS